MDVGAWASWMSTKNSTFTPNSSPIMPIGFFPFSINRTLKQKWNSMSFTHPLGRLWSPMKRRSSICRTLTVKNTFKNAQQVIPKFCNSSVTSSKGVWPFSLNRSSYQRISLPLLLGLTKKLKYRRSKTLIYPLKIEFQCLFPVYLLCFPLWKTWLQWSLKSPSSPWNSFNPSLGTNMPFINTTKFSSTKTEWERWKMLAASLLMTTSFSESLSQHRK